MCVCILVYDLIIDTVNGLCIMLSSKLSKLSLVIVYYVTSILDLYVYLFRHNGGDLTSLAFSSNTFSSS